MWNGSCGVMFLVSEWGMEDALCESSSDVARSFIGVSAVAAVEVGGAGALFEDM